MAGFAWACGSGPECISPRRTVQAGGEGPSEVASLQSREVGQPLQPPPTPATAAPAPGAQSKNSQVHGKPSCKAAWRFPRHAPRCEGEINLNNYCPQLAWPHPSASVPWKGAGPPVPQPALPGLLRGLHPACRETLHPGCQALQRLEAFPLLSMK